MRFRQTCEREFQAFRKERLATGELECQKLISAAQSHLTQARCPLTFLAQERSSKGRMGFLQSVTPMSTSWGLHGRTADVTARLETSYKLICRLLKRHCQGCPDWAFPPTVLPVSLPLASS